MTNPASPTQDPSSKPVSSSGPRPGEMPRPNRDFVTTIRADGSRFFLHPADVRGFWTRARRISALVLIAIYLALPWIHFNGHPAIFLDIASRRFHLFGHTLAFQDAWLLFFGITGLGFTLFFLTSLLGRVWCGWACPQTVFLDHVYRRIERWIEGDAVARRLLDAAPWTRDKILRRVTKQIAFIAVSAVITHLFLAYFVSLPELWRMMHHAPTENWSAFLFVTVATGILYFNFAWFREQLCLIICPYGRMQSVLIDDHSLVIGYDARRGEPRGKATKTNNLPRGDCVDCNRCVQVCPTGIDIRQGLQIECIACAACIDACDEVMAKVKKPPGLIRYDSTAAFNGGKTRWWRTRIALYLVLLATGAAAATYAFSTVRPAVLSVTRLQGAPYFLDTDAVRNQFLVRLINKRDTTANFTLSVSTKKPSATPLHVVGADGPFALEPLAEGVWPVVVRVPRANYDGPFDLIIEAKSDDGTFTLHREARFTGPDARLLRAETTKTFTPAP